MSKVVADHTNPKHKKPVTDNLGHYDLDGVTQTHDFKVIVAGDKTAPNKPVQKKGMQALKLKFQRWLSAWDD